MSKTDHIGCVERSKQKIILHVPPKFIGHEVLINHLSPAMNWECIRARGPYTKMQQQLVLVEGRK